MHLSNTQCQEWLDSIDFEEDRRRPPDGRRAGRFKAGWRDAAERGRIYGSTTLKELTWTNLGNRLGAELGQATDDEIEEAFTCFADHYVSG